MKRIGAILLVILAGGWVAWAADEPSGEEKAIRGTIDSYVDAYNQGDAKRVAAHWSETAEWISPSGQRFQGRAAIEKEMAAMFAANKGVKIAVSDTKVRLITPDVAMEEGTVTVTREGAAPDGSTYIAIHAKKSGKWQLDSVRETALPTASAEDGDGLDQLEWLVGDWVDSAEDSTLETSVAWTKNGAFLTSSFRVVTSDEDDLEGTQVIGWDPVARTVRSWMFDSDGGFGHGTWRKQENRWIVNFTQTLPDCRQAVSTNIYTLGDENSYTWESTGRSVDGESLPNIEPVKVVRAAAAQPASPQGDSPQTSKPTTKPTTKPAAKSETPPSPSKSKK